MKKLLGILILNLVFFNPVNAFELNNCFTIEHEDKELIQPSFEKQTQYERLSYTADLNKGVLVRFRIITDSWIENLKKESPEYASKVEKFDNTNYKITFVNDRVIKAERQSSVMYPLKTSYKVVIDLEKNTVNTFLYAENEVNGKNFKTFNSVRQCKKNNSKSSDVANSGSGFFINNKGYFITNNHVVDGCTQSKITFDEKSVDAELIAKDETLDLALLRAKVKPKDYLNISDDPPEKMQKIFVAGYPFGKGLSDDLKFSQGIISSVKGFADNSNQIQIDAAINSGNSGGPIVNEDGDLVAVAVSGLDKSQSEGIGFGIKASSVKNFLEVNDAKYSSSSLISFGMNNKKLNKLMEASAVYTFCN